MNPISAFRKISRLRNDMNLPSLVTKAGENYTLAILRLGPHEVYGMNTWGIAGKAAGLQMENRGLFNELASVVQKRQFPRGVRGSLSHAEGDAIVSAYNAGFTDQYRRGIMFVDREVCETCRGQRGPGSLARLLTLVGMNYLVIYELIEFPGTFNKLEITPAN